MDRAEFAQMIGKICRYWERKVPANEPKNGAIRSDLDEWYDAVSWIPAGCGEEIYQRFIKMESRPINIPLKIQEVHKGMMDVPKRATDFLIGMVMKHAEDNDMNHLEAFYDLRHAIKTKGINIGPVMVWLKSQGSWVDMGRFNEPSCINFQHLKEWLANPGRMKVTERPVRVGEVLGREPGEDDE